MSAREVVGRLGTALLTEEATEDDAARVLVALGGPVPEPVVPPSTPDAATRLVAVPSPTHMVSRSHLAVTTAGANLLAQDLGSSNGTVLVRDGISPVLLATALPTPLLVGDLLDVGDGVTLRVAPPR